MILPLLQPERSIDDFVGHDGATRLSALLADEGAVDQEDNLYIKELRRLVYEALALLDDRERHIISNRFGLLGGEELTLEQIGRSLNLSRERVRQLEREAKRKLRLALRRARSARGCSSARARPGA